MDLVNMRLLKMRLQQKKKHPLKKQNTFHKKNTNIISTISTVNGYQLSGIWEMDEYF